MYFNGFSKKTIDFLVENKEKNSKEWFQENKHVYNSSIIEPTKNLILELSPTILNIDPKIDVSLKINKAISRLNRDTRFSKDKSLYKDNFWIVFKRPDPNWKACKPGFFFEFNTTYYRYGCGFYYASKQTMDNFRDALRYEEEVFLDITKRVERNTGSRFILEGDTYKKPLYESEHAEIQKWYSLKTFFYCSKSSIDNKLFSRDLLTILSKDFQEFSDFYKYLINATTNED